MSFSTIIDTTYTNLIVPNTNTNTGGFQGKTPPPSPEEVRNDLLTQAKSYPANNYPLEENYAVLIDQMIAKYTYGDGNPKTGCWAGWVTKDLNADDADPVTGNKEVQAWQKKARQEAIGAPASTPDSTLALRVALLENAVARLVKP
jgi:hypothetical protein